MRGFTLNRTAGTHIPRPVATAIVGSVEFGPILTWTAEMVIQPRPVAVRHFMKIETLSARLSKMIGNPDQIQPIARFPNDLEFVRMGMLCAT